MININANDVRKEVIRGFSIICDKCGSIEVEFTINGAEEHGEVGEIEVGCGHCKQSEYSEEAT